MSAATGKAKVLVTEGDPNGRYSVPEDSAFDLRDGDRVIPVEFLRSDELESIGQALIEKRESLAHLREGAGIAYLWKREGGKKNGQSTFGQCRKPSGLLGYYAAVDFIIWLAADHCRASLFTHWQVEASLFHELKHTGMRMTDEGLVWTIQGHDWEGFAEEIVFYGDWRPDVVYIRKAFQLTLFEA